MQHGTSYSSTHSFKTLHLLFESRVLKKFSENAQWVLSVCTGSALLAKSGLLDGKKATSNKRSWQWVISQSNQVNWIQESRWVIDDKFYTSSGVSAGIDMTLGFIADRHNLETARKIAKEIEYNWQEDRQIDDFWDVFYRYSRAFIKMVQ